MTGTRAGSARAILVAAIEKQEARTRLAEQVSTRVNELCKSRGMQPVRPRFGPSRRDPLPTVTSMVAELTKLREEERVVDSQIAQAGITVGNREQHERLLFEAGCAYAVYDTLLAYDGDLAQLPHLADSLKLERSKEDIMSKPRRSAEARLAVEATRKHSRYQYEYWPQDGQGVFAEGRRRGVEEAKAILDEVIPEFEKSLALLVTTHGATAWSHADNPFWHGILTCEWKLRNSVKNHANALRGPHKEKMALVRALECAETIPHIIRQSQQFIDQQLTVWADVLRSDDPSAVRLLEAFNFDNSATARMVSPDEIATVVLEVEHSAEGSELEAMRNTLTALDKLRETTELGQGTAHARASEAALLWA